MKDRFCGKCGQSKELTTGFSRDTKGKDGYALRCKACKNSAAQARREKLAPEPQKKLIQQVEKKTPMPVKVPIKGERGPRDPIAEQLAKLEEKYPHHMVLTMGKGKPYLLQIHSRDPDRVYRAESFSQLLKQALA